MPCEWNPEFATRRDLDYNTENKPYIEWRAQLGVEDNVESRAEPGEEESVVRVFMRGPDESDVCLPQADKVENFCYDANLESLRAEEGEVSESLRPVALVDERSFEGGIEHSRANRGPLTARGLYQELKKPRFRRGGSNHSAGANSANPNPDESQHEEPDAERRLIFVTDLDSWSIYALIGTASYHQAFALRAALYRHLAFETFIGVALSSEGFPTFQLAFHLPYYVWRSSQKPCEDHRQYANGDPLRHSRDVSFLNWNTRGSSGFLYEAQISCVVAGSDEWRWVAYCFVDTFFDAVEEARETVLSYHEDSLVPEGMRADPFTYGVTNADNSIQNPREYFLMVFRIRIDQVKREWQQVVEKVYQSIREYEQTHHYPLSLSREHSSSKEAEDDDKNVRKSLLWVIQVRGLSRKLSLDLSKTVNACEGFFHKYAVNFQNLSGLADGHRSLPVIQTKLDELESLKKTLESLAVRCDDFTRDLELHLNHEVIEVGNRQRELAQDNKGLSVTTMFIYPVALTAWIFSMNKDVIPFIPANFGSFVCLILIFSALGIVIHVVQPYRFGRWQVVLASAGQTSWDRKIRGPRLKMLRFLRKFFLGQPTNEIQRDVENEAG